MDCVDVVSCCQSSEEEEEEKEEIEVNIQKPFYGIQQKVILKVGWMFKHNSFFPFQWWSKYWFVLNQITCSLSYFQNSSIPSKIKIFPMLEVIMQIGEEIKTKARLPIFLQKAAMIKLKRRRQTLLLCCDDEAIANGWKDALSHFAIIEKRPCLILNGEDENLNEVYVPYIKLENFCNPYIDFDVMLALEKANLKHDREIPEQKFMTPPCFLCDPKSMIKPPKKYVLVKFGKEDEEVPIDVKEGGSRDSLDSRKYEKKKKSEKDKNEPENDENEPGKDEHPEPQKGEKKKKKRFGFSRKNKKKKE